tara:strand:- start:4719 stop:5423 length:705 start_codon:yes stop_codon:yes gene_type:complete
MDRSQEVPSLSIVIPTLNEASRLPLLLADLRTWPYNLDLLVVDGGSTDLTIFITEIQGFKVLKSFQANRGYQLNKGALKAKGDWFLFLHADSRLEKKWADSLTSIISKSSSEEYVWYFNFKINKSNLQFRILEFAVALRSRILKRPYGDQGILIHKNLYYSSGGYSSLKIMEDIDFITRLGKSNKLKSIKSSIYTDEKKWINCNIIKRALKNARLRRKWRQGFDINKLAEEYNL